MGEANYQLIRRLPQGHIQNHHQGKSNREADGSQVGVLPLAGLRDELLHHHVEHRARGKGQQVGECRGNLRGQKNGEKGAGRLYNA